MRFQPLETDSPRTQKGINGGINILPLAEELFYISNPILGLWFEF